MKCTNVFKSIQLDPSTTRVVNRFGRMRDLTFFALISGFELKIGAGSGNFKYRREQDFVLLWGCVAGFARGKDWDTTFQFLLELVN